MAAKIFMNVLVVIFNYIASKLLIFRSRKEES
jgi:putative flippase GtrA